MVTWFQNGDHPKDDYIPGREGKIVRRYRHPQISDTDTCPECGHLYHVHGFIDASHSDIPHKVCPGDTIREYQPGKYIAVSPLDDAGSQFRDSLKLNELICFIRKEHSSIGNYDDYPQNMQEAVALKKVLLNRLIDLIEKE